MILLSINLITALEYRTEKTVKYNDKIELNNRTYTIEIWNKGNAIRLDNKFLKKNQCRKINNWKVCLIKNISKTSSRISIEKPIGNLEWSIKDNPARNYNKIRTLLKWSDIEYEIRLKNTGTEKITVKYSDKGINKTIILKPNQEEELKYKRKIDNIAWRTDISPKLEYWNGQETIKINFNCKLCNLPNAFSIQAIESVKTDINWTSGMIKLNNTMNEQLNYEIKLNNKKIKSGKIEPYKSKKLTTNGNYIKIWNSKINNEWVK